MNFLRPEVGQFLRNWREPIVLGIVVAFGLLIFRHGQNRADVTLQFLGLLIGIPFALGIVPAIRAVRLRRNRQDPGLVEVAERQITYLGPQFGGSVSVDAISRIEIITTDDGPHLPDVFWTLFHFDGPALSIPSNAAGADQLLNAFAALPGFDYQAVIRAMGSTLPSTYLIWKSPNSV